MSVKGRPIKSLSKKREGGSKGPPCLLGLKHQAPSTSKASKVKYLRSGAILRGHDPLWAPLAWDTGSRSADETISHPTRHLDLAQVSGWDFFFSLTRRKKMIPARLSTVVVLAVLSSAQAAPTQEEIRRVDVCWAACDDA